MKELNDLVDLAKKADREVTWSLLPFDLAKDGWGVEVVDYIASMSPYTILAIAEAFRALEQRAEAAEAECARLDKESRNLSTQLGGCDRERRSALRELAELNKQKPVGTVSISMDWNTHRNIATVNMRPDLVVAEMKDGDELFTRPAPAINLAELVPDEALRELDGVIDWIKGLPIPTNSATKWLIKMSDLRDAILCNIEEQSQ